MTEKELLHFLKKLVQRLHKIELLESNQAALTRTSALMKELNRYIKILQRRLKDEL